MPLIHLWFQRQKLQKCIGLNERSNSINNFLFRSYFHFAQPWPHRRRENPRLCQKPFFHQHFYDVALVWMNLFFWYLWFFFFSIFWNSIETVALSHRLLFTNPSCCVQQNEVFKNSLRRWKVPYKRVCFFMGRSFNLSYLLHLYCWCHFCGTL